MSTNHHLSTTLKNSFFKHALDKFRIRLPPHPATDLRRSLAEATVDAKEGAQTKPRTSGKIKHNRHTHAALSWKKSQFRLGVVRFMIGEKETIDLLSDPLELMYQLL